MVVPRNGQVLIGMPDATSLNIVNKNIDSMQVEIAECKTNTRQEMQSVAECYTNMDIDAINKQEANLKKTKRPTSQLIISFPPITQMQIKEKAVK